MSAGSAVLVVAAVIEREGKILIGQRKRGDWGEFKWEFPGGKVENGEDPRAAMARELREELQIEPEIGPEITRYEYAYPGRRAVQLVFFRVTKFNGEPVNREFEAVAWDNQENLPGYDFLDGDVEFVERLARGEFSEPARNPAHAPD